MDIVIFGVCYFLVSIFLVEYLLRDTVPVEDSYISTYLTGKYSWIEDIGFVALAVSLWILRDYVETTEIPFFRIASVALVLVMATRRIFPLLGNWNSTLLTRLHVASAGVAFLGSYAGLVVSAYYLPYPMGHILLGLLAGLILVNLVILVKPDMLKLQAPEQTAEKVSAAWIGGVCLILCVYKLLVA